MATASAMLKKANPSVSLPAVPKVVSKDPQDGDTEVDPSAVIRIGFSEPILPNAAGFSLTVNGRTTPFKLLSQGQEANYLRPAQDVWLVPEQRLSLGSRVQVSVGGLQDLDLPTPNTLERVTWAFTVRGADELGSLAGVGTYSDMVVHKGSLYAVENTGTSVGGTFDIAGAPIQAIRAEVHRRIPSRASRGVGLS